MHHETYGTGLRDIPPTRPEDRLSSIEYRMKEVERKLWECEKEIRALNSVILSGGDVK
jgi:hypothetical protein